jgi:hypothetical protein
MAGTRSERLRRVLSDLHTAATMPRVTAVLSHGSEEEDAVLRRCRRRHPRHKIVASKAVGPALLALGDITNMETYDVRWTRAPAPASGGS